MSTKVVGKLDSWSDADLGGSNFIAFDEGSNPVRIFTSPYQFYIHWSEDKTGANRKVRCATDGCPLCQEGIKASARWFLGAISRKTKKIGIMEIGPQIFKQIHGLSKKDKWGDPRKYDIDVVRQPKGSQPLYVVSPEPKEPITDEERGMIKEFMARVDLTEMSAAPSVEEVMEKMGLESKPAAKASAVDNDFEETPAAAPVVADADDDFDFNS